jgi:hypothetical protein
MEAMERRWGSEECGEGAWPWAIEVKVWGNIAFEPQLGSLGWQWGRAIPIFIVRV